MKLSAKTVFVYATAIGCGFEMGKIVNAVGEIVLIRILKKALPDVYKNAYTDRQVKKESK